MNQNFLFFFCFAFSLCIHGDNFTQNHTSQKMQPVYYDGYFLTMSSWLDVCSKLTKNRDSSHLVQETAFAVCGTDKNEQWAEFELVLQSWLAMMSSGALRQADNWFVSNIGQAIPSDCFFDTTESCNFTPFAQKIVAQPEDKFYVRGDLHGDIASLVKQLESLSKQGVIDDNFRIIHDRTWFVFLGDYVDRGQYGCEVLYTMMRLALANPDRVIYARGNHEDVSVSKRYGFYHEIEKKFGKAETRHPLISRINDFMPVVLYLGCLDADEKVTNYLQCCHGGIELGYDPSFFLDQQSGKYQLLGTLNRKSMCQKLLKNALQYKSSLQDIKSCQQEDNLLSRSPSSKGALGYMWSDFNVEDIIDIIDSVRGVGIECGKNFTQDFLRIQSSEQSFIKGILRAHQHSTALNDPMMKGIVRSKGVYKLWNGFESCVSPQKRSLHSGLVWTFNVGADSEYGYRAGFDFDTYAVLTVQPSYHDWSMEVYNTQVIKA